MTPPTASKEVFKRHFVLLLALTLGLAFLGIFKAPLHVMGTPPLQAQGYFLTQAEVGYSTDPNVPAISMAQAQHKTTVQLPDSWDNTKPGFEGQAWYHFYVRLDPERPLPNALFAPRVIMNAHVYVNGQWIGGEGAMQGELARNWNRPFLFQFSPELLHGGDNLIQVQVAGYQNYRSGLGRVWLAPSSELEPLYASAHRWQVTGSMLATLVAFGSGLMILAFSRAFPKDRGMVYLGLAVMVFAVRNTGYFLDWAPLPHAQWGQAVHSLHAWFACLYAQFLIRYMGVSWKPVRFALWTYAVVVTLITFGVGGDGILQFTFWLLIPILPLVFFLNLFLLAHSWKNRDSEGMLLGCTSTLFLLLSSRDLSIMLDALPNESVLLSQYTGILLFLCGAWIIYRRLSELMQKLTTSNESLNSELAIREQQLFRQFNLLRKVEQQRAKDDERRRIMQDIHDGVGSSLVSALNLCEIRPLQPEEMRDVLQECLDDLRMAIDSLDPQSDDLLALLGNFRWRYERRLRACAVELRWVVQDIPKLEGYSSRDLFDLLRIVQEVFANALKHAQAKTIDLSVRWDKTHSKVQLRICDDGVGMPDNTLGRGRGLAHMKIRAKAIHVDLHMDKGLGEAGVGVHIGIPKVRLR
ncbi:MAG TPA: ATP-binding protein [Limnobacter sp.]|nr:ATP-binding protein [Limnobacter sp.]